MVELVCFTLPYAAFPFDRALQGVAAAGYRAVGFGLPHEGVLVPSELAGTPELRRLQAQVSGYGLRIAMLHGPRGKRQSRVDQLRRRIDQVVALGAHTIQMSGVSSYRPSPAEPLSAETLTGLHAEFVADMRTVAPDAERAGVSIMLKPHSGDTATAAILRATLEEIGSPAVQACYDPGNVHFYEGVDPAEDIRSIAAMVRSVVAKDHRGPRGWSDFPVPGEGDVDFPSIFRTLSQSGFAGPVAVERVDGAGGVPAKPEVLDDRLRAARRYLEQTLAQAGLTVID